MAFQVPPSKKSIRQNRFEFEVDGRTYSMPLLKFLPVASAEEFEREHNVAGVLAAVDSEEAKAVLRAMDGEQIAALIDAWQEESGVGVGESVASSES